MKTCRQRMAALLCVCLVVHLAFPASAGKLEIPMQKGSETQISSDSDWEGDEELVNDLPEEEKNGESAVLPDTDSENPSEKVQETVAASEEETDDPGKETGESEEEPVDSGETTVDLDEIASDSNADLIVDLPAQAVLPAQKAMAMPAVVDALLDLSQAEIEVKGSYMYIGEQIKPEIEVTLDGQPLTENDNYTVSYGDNTNAGKGTITIEGVDGNSTGKKTCTFEIEKAIVTPDNCAKYEAILGWSLDLNPTVDDEAQKKAVYGQLLGSNIPITKNSNARAWRWEPGPGDSSIYLEELGEHSYTAICYLGTMGVADDHLNIKDPRAEITLNVAQRDLSTLNSGDLSISAPNVEYTGEALTPDLTVSASLGKRYSLTKGTDYTIVGYADNTNAGTATVTIEGKGNYTGQATGSFTISPVSPRKLLENDSRFEANGSDFNWKVPFGTSLTDIKGQLNQLASGWDVTVKNSSITQPGYDFVSDAITNKRLYPFNVSFDNTSNTNYSSLSSGSVIMYVQLDAPRSITETDVTVAFKNAQTVYPYTGRSIEPEVVVTDQLWGGTQTLPAQAYKVTYKNNTAAGTATAVITGQGVYTGSRELTFEIKEVPNIANADITLDDTVDYDNGNAITPSVTVTLSGKTLTQGTDYTLSYARNTYPGAAYVTVTGTASGDLGYYGEKTVSFFILPPTLTAAYGTPLRDISISENPDLDQAAFWTWKTPGAFAGSGSTSPNEFQADFDDGTTRETVSVKVAVEAKDIRDSSVTFRLDGGPFVYDPQNPVTPQEVLVDQGTGRTLVKDTDYTVSYTNNTQAGTGTVTVTGTGNYKGSRSENFTIAKADCNLQVTGSVLAADGSISLMARDPAASLIVSRQGDGAITYGAGDPAVLTATGTAAGVDLSPGKPGSTTLTITVAETANYKGASREYPVTVSPIPINRTDIQVASGPWIYNGSAQTPALTVTDPQIASGNPLSVNADYTVTYTDNINAGTARVTVTGIGDYTGTKSAIFTIEQAEYNEAAPSSVSAVYGQKHKEITLPKAANHELFWTWRQPESEVGDVGVHTAEIYLAESRNYKEQTASVQVNVTPKALEPSMAKLEYEEHGYAGRALEPGVTVIHNGRVVPVSQYTVAYADNTERGTATVTLTGQGNYTGTITREFVITQAEIRSEHVTLAQGTWTYNGRKHTPSEAVSVYENTLVRDVDYTVGYGENIHAGNGTVIITGQGNYTGTATVSFTIGKAVNPATSSDAVYQAVYGQKLEELAREDGWSWENPKSPVGNAGENRHPIFLAETRDYLRKNGQSTVSVARKQLEEAMITVDGTRLVYDGTDKRPAVHVNDENGPITEADYECNYENNLHAGQALVTVRAKGNYTGEVKRIFVIEKAQPSLHVGAGLTIEKVLGGGSFSLEAVLSNGAGLSYASSSPEVATVDQQGTVTLVAAGTAELTISYGGDRDYAPVQALVRLTVTARRASGGSGGSGGSDSSSTYIYDSVPAGYSGGTQIIGRARVPVYVETGAWSQNGDGVWSFTDQSGQPAVNRWVAAYNPYANLTGGQSAFDWFWFDPEGQMATGWHRDADGETYYLNPSSDGTRGRMITGWYLIDGIWYYFETKPDGKRGRLLRGTVTPDGYQVDENGAWIP